MTLVTTTNDSTVDFGYCDAFPNSVGDRVWHDLDCDGLQDPGEPGIAGVTVNARDDQAVLLSTAVTDAQGNERPYRVRESGGVLRIRIGDPDVFVGRYGPNNLFRNDGPGPGGAPVVAANANR